MLNTSSSSQSFQLLAVHVFIIWNAIFRTRNACIICACICRQCIRHKIQTEIRTLNGASSIKIMLNGSISRTVKHHRRAVAQHCINGDSLSQWRRANLTPYRMKTPEPTAKKFVTVDYVQEATNCAKFPANPPTGSVSANRWNITEFFFLFIPFFGNSPTGQTVTAWWIFTRNVSNDAVSRKDVPFGVRRSKINT